MGAPRAVVLLSGGLDSATVLAIARERGCDLYALSFDYGQRHRVELEAADEIARRFGVVEHRTVRVDLRAIGGSALTDAIDVPHGGTGSGTVPVTYVPARNTVFMALGMGYAEVVGATELHVGVNAVDYSGYPDCRPEFLAAFESMARLATVHGVGGGEFRVVAPLIAMTKTDIIREAIRLGVEISRTRSCYDPSADGHACGDCDSCLIRARAFADLGMADPVQSATGSL